MNNVSMPAAGTVAARPSLMSKSLGIVLVMSFAVGGPARGDDLADARTEMSQALLAQVDQYPAPITLPTRSAAPQHAAAPSAVQRGINQRAALGAGAREAEARHAQASSQAVIRQAQAATAAAAGQAQGQAAKKRASHPRSSPLTH